MVSKHPPPEMMTSADRERLKEKLEEMPDEVEEEHQPSRNGAVRSIEELQPEFRGFRYKTVNIFGIAKPVVFRSLTARHFENIAREADRNILLYSICDEAGRLIIDDSEALSNLIDEYDARTYAELISAANIHCLGRGGLDDMIEEAAGN